MENDAPQSEALAIPEKPDPRLVIAEAVASGQRINLEALSIQLGMSIREVAHLFNDPSVLKEIRTVTRARAGIALHTRGVQRLVDITDTGDERQALTAINILGKLSGDMKDRQQVNVQLSFEELQRRRESSDAPGKGLFDIVPPAAIEAEFEEVPND
jgi:hypothetical protein